MSGSTGWTAPAAGRRGGYGLGLAIAHTIAQSHRGQIEVRSSREEGTVFTVTLPHGRTEVQIPCLLNPLETHRPRPTARLRA